jgi:hypothetical protein
VEGVPTISANGNLKVKISGLRPATDYTCRISCAIGGLFADGICSADTDGKINALLPGLGLSGALANGCGQPIVTVFVDDPADDGDFCESGYGSP